MLDPRAFLVNNKTGRVVAATFVEFLSGNPTTPSICFTDSPDSGLQCDNLGAVNYIKNGINLGELGTISSLIGGSDTQIQFNNSGSFDGSSDLTWDDTGKKLSVGGNIAVPAGSQSAPSISVGTTDNGIYSPGADQVAISTSGTGRLFIDGSGNVGLGTSAPGANLDLVDGNTFSGIRVAHLATDATTKIGHFTGRHYTNAEESVLGLRIQSDSSNNSVILGGGSGVLNAATDIRFYTAANNTTTVGTQRMVIDSSGNVGVGTTSPARTLHVVGEAVVFNTNQFLVSPTTDNVRLYARDSSTGAQNLSFNIGTTEAARIDTSGRLLVGTSTSIGQGATTQIRNDSAGYALALQRSTEAVFPVRIISERSRGTVGSPGALQDGDIIFEQKFYGYDGSSYVESSSIAAHVDGTVSDANDSVPGRLTFSTTASGAGSPTEQLRITSDRYIRLASGSGGIQFNGDTAAANALDDYEEGAWTPALVFDSGSATLSLAEGSYTKIGRQVFVYCILRVSTLSSASGNAYIEGLPFDANANGEFPQYIALGNTTNAHDLTGIINPDSTVTANQSTTINLYKDVGFSTRMSASDMLTGASGTALRFSMTYVV